MKKALLLGTSAIVAAGMFAGTAQAADPIEIRVGGFMNQWFGYQDNDDPAGVDTQTFDQWSNSEIIFNGKTTLDNGLEVGVQVQLEANTSGDQIDESFAFVEGSFGRFVIGSENDAGYLMHYAAPSVGLPINSGSQTQHIFNPTGSSVFRNVFGSTFITPANDNDGQKITYFTPRFSGFQFGVSYLPDIDPTGGDRNGLTTEQASYTDGFSVGLNYVNSFSGFDLAASGGFYYASAPDGTGIDDFEAFTLGLNVGFGGFTLGGSYADNSEGTISGVNSTEGEGYDVGLSYETGALGFSLTYYHGEVEGDTTINGDDEHDSFAGSVSYALGPGVSVIGTVGYSDFEGEAAGTGDDNDGFYVTTGLALSF
ncbi:MAG: porin [Pseudomonadota bacterium]